MSENNNSYTEMVRPFGQFLQRSKTVSFLMVLLVFVTGALLLRWMPNQSDLPQLRAFSKLPESDPSWFGFLMTVQPEAGFTRNDLAKFLESRNIQTRNLFAGNILRHPCFEPLAEGVDYRVVGELANTETIMNDSLWIGLYPGMGEAKLDYMVASIREFCGK